MARNTLSNLAKRQAAISGRVTRGDIPELYAAQDAMARQDAAQMGGTPGLGAGSGGTVPMPTAVGGGGAVGGSADTGLPGAGFVNEDLERAYTRAFRGAPGEAPDRGEMAMRGGLNIDPADPYGVEFGQGLSSATQIAGLLGVPYSGMANQFVNLMLKDAQIRNDQFFDSLIEGTAPIDYSSGVAITRDPTGPMEFEAALISGDVPIDPGSGVTIGRGPSDEGFSGFTGESADFGVGPGSDFGADLATGDIDVATDSGVSIGRDGGGGDAGSGGGGGQGGGGVCFAAGTKVLMGDETERNIETLQLGDKVMAFDADNGEKVPCDVVGRFAHRLVPVWRLNGDTLCTPGHRFFAQFGENGWGFWPLEEIPIGGRIMDANGGEIVVERIEDAGERRDVFNITVERLHTYIANGHRVHNIKHSGGYISEDRVPDQMRGDVDEVLQEGEYVIQADVVDMLGREFFDGINKMAELARKRR